MLVVVGCYDADMLWLFKQPEQKAVRFVGTGLRIRDDGTGCFVNSCSVAVLPFPQQYVEVLAGGVARLANCSTNLICEAVEERKIGSPPIRHSRTDKYHQLAGFLSGDYVVGDIQGVAKHETELRS